MNASIAARRAFGVDGPGPRPQRSEHELFEEVKLRYVRLSFIDDERKHPCTIVFDPEPAIGQRTGNTDLARATEKLFPQTADPTADTPTDDPKPAP